MKEKMIKEEKMKLKEKIAIILLAVLITFVGFTLMASPLVEMMKVG